MLPVEIFDVGSFVHALIFSTSNPEILIPIKATVRDLQFDNQLPRYKLRIVKFYDSWAFLKEHFVDQSFNQAFNKPSVPFLIPKTTKSVGDLEDYFFNCKFQSVCIDEVYVFKTKIEMMGVLNKIQDFQIIKYLRLVKDMSMRTIYQSPFRVMDGLEYKTRLRKMYIDKFGSEEAFNSMYDDIYCYGIDRF